jgi:hypothetical protein
LTWAVAAVFAIAAVAGGYWAYVTIGPGRTVDTSGIRPGMTMAEVEGVLGEADEVVESGDQWAWRYGRTHVWFRGVPGAGGMVTETTTGPERSESGGGGKGFRPKGKFKGPAPDKDLPSDKGTNPEPPPKKDPD